MNLLSLLTPGNLLIWIPGLCLLISTFYTSSRIKSGTTTMQVRLVNQGLFVLALIILFYVPSHEINKAIAFANAIDESGEVVDSYQDIPFEAKDSFRMTAMSEEERIEFMSYSGAVDRGPVIVDGEELVLKLQRPLAWGVLFVLIISSLLVFSQSPRKFIQS